MDCCLAYGGAVPSQACLPLLKDLSLYLYLEIRPFACSRTSQTAAGFLPKFLHLNLVNNNLDS